MKRHAGLWIDHRRAFVVFAGVDSNQTENIESGVEARVRFSGNASAEDGSADDRLGRKFTADLEKYYDKVIAHIRDADSILIFGPGEAGGELEKRLVAKGLGGRIAGVESADKMTDHQITAKVRQHYKQPNLSRSAAA